MSILIGNINVNLRHNPRAKRVIIKIRNGEAELVIPKRVSLKRALKFLSSKEEWLIGKIKNAPQKIPLQIGTELTLFGENYSIIYGGLRGKSQISGGRIILFGDILMANKKIKKLLHECLRNEIEKIAALKVRELNASYQKISIRDNISRWGSCSTKGNLAFCWRLIFAPYEVTEYLVCHELAHLKEMNHSPKFWAHVATLYPDYKRAESWLKKNGNSLYLYE